MITGHIVAALTPTATRTLRRWVINLGGLGLIPLGLLDSSIVPIPGSMDVVTIILSARDGAWWFYYAMMATAGSVIGGYVTYRLARKGGKESLERKLSVHRAKDVYQIFERFGFGAIAIPAILPPPVPMVPFLLAAGAMQYPTRKFISALVLGRIVRYTILAYLAARYGRKIIVFIAAHGASVGLAFAGLLIATAIMIYFFWRGSGSTERSAS